MNTFALWRLFHRSPFDRSVGKRVDVNVADVANAVDVNVVDTNTANVADAAAANEHANVANGANSAAIRVPAHRGGDGNFAGLLAVIAFAAATAIFLTVLGGLHGFIWRASPDHTIACFADAAKCTSRAHVSDNAEFYVTLAMFACVLLIVPFTTLAGSAARLAATRRDERLATLRLVGATTAQVTRLTAFEAVSQAVLGALIGIVGYFAIMPLIMLLTFENRRFTFEQLWVGPLALVAAVVGVALLALVSALLTLRRVAITPLGVSARQSSSMPSGWRAVIFVVVLIGGFMMLNSLQMFANADVIVVYAIVFGIIGGCFMLLNLIGSWVVSTVAKTRVRHPKNAAVMIGMRRILDNPKRAWRNVSGIALAVFIAGVTSVCGMLASGENADAESVMMMHDISLGGTLTLVFAAVLAAVSSGIMQSASVYDQASEYHMLILEGTDARTLRSARFSEVLTPLNTVIIVAAGCSMFLMLPLIGSALTAPGVLLRFVFGIALCYALVSVGAVCANRTAAHLDTVSRRRDD
ncbi:FtsX-like permease family protein [uncultured Bifidobacterium sp.]|uniref:FtsX-like permease family protein n=1 Tax=uncultured Bifidobacterium sp. TaxID=165187 RepID=UPI002583AF70|nr:FtsX-like permease family protein [uncultured Bifidobacterium sp.]MEE0654472.1 FtsX-like permease family protein [Bifidobacterium criceti]